MSVGTSRNTTRLLCWLSTDDAAARLDACPALHLLHLTWGTSPKPNVSTTHSDPTSQSSTHNHKILAP